MAEIQKALCVTLFYERKEDWQVKIVQDEAESLLESLDFHAVYSMSFNIRAVDSATLFSSGQVEQISQSALYFNADFVYIDSALSARHQRNLEMRTGFPVLDRNELIIEIFASRASSREARLQVQLARLQFLLPRLRQSGVIYAQQRGGVRGAKGEGEKQTELSRRRILEEISKLRKAIEAVRRQRDTQRKKRLSSDTVSFALVGYTNCGKSTILGKLTGSRTSEEDKLFATLDPLERVLRLKSGMKVILSDTVGFVSNLPHFLIDAFSSTLEEARLADALIIVLDASAEDLGGKWETTVTVLNELRAMDKPVILAVNKTDLGIREDFALATVLAEHPDAVMLSARTGDGLDELRNRIEETASALMGTQTVTFDVSDSAEIEECYRSGRLVSADYSEKTVTLVMRKK